MPINDADLIAPWVISITRDPTPQLPSQSKAFQIEIKSVTNGKIDGSIVPTGPSLTGQFRPAGSHTGQATMGLKLNIDGTQIFLSGPVTKPDDTVLFDGSYNRLGLVGLGNAAPFDPGETGTGGGNTTT